jgi:hypothetical protein
MKKYVFAIVAAFLIPVATLFTLMYLLFDPGSGATGPALAAPSVASVPGELELHTVDQNNRLVIDGQGDLADQHLYNSCLITNTLPVTEGLFYVLEDFNDTIYRLNDFTGALGKVTADHITTTFVTDTYTGTGGASLRIDYHDLPGGWRAGV